MASRWMRAAPDRQADLDACGADDRTDVDASTACDGRMPFAFVTGPGPRSMWNGTLGMPMCRGGGHVWSWVWLRRHQR